MHSASVSAAVNVNALSFQSSRKPTRRSFCMTKVDENDRGGVQEGRHAGRPLQGLAMRRSLNDVGADRRVRPVADQPYSVRRATDGSTRAARQAGMRLARLETPSSSEA